jgi:O-antigen/teichoic acid export membrane protein
LPLSFQNRPGLQIQLIRHLPLLVVLLDQAVISGTRLLVQMGVGRSGGPEQLGLFGAAMGIVMVMLGFQEALITTPYTVYSPAREANGTRREFAWGALRLGLILLVVMMAIWAGVMAWRMSSGAWPAGWLAIGLALFWFGPFQLLREFGRRWLLANHARQATLVLDALVSLILLVALGAMLFAGKVDARLAFGLMTLSNVVFIGLWLHRYRSEFRLDRDGARDFAGLAWRYGRWIAGENFCSVLMMFYLTWHLAFFLGERAAGQLTACMTVVLLANPFLLGYSGYLGPRAAGEWHVGGWSRLGPLIWQSLLTVTAVLGGLAVLLALRGDWLLGLMFGGEYLGNGSMVAMLGVGMIGLGASYVLTTALQTAGRPWWNFAGSLVSAVLLVVWSQLYIRNSIGPAASGFAIAVFAGTMVRLAGFLLSQRQAGGEKGSDPGGSRTGSGNAAPEEP